MKHPEQGILKYKENRVYFRMLRELIIACQEEGSISVRYPAEDILQELVVLHRGMLFQWRVDEEQYDVAQRGRRMAEHLLNELTT